MNAQTAIRELKEIRQYCTPTSLEALNYAIEVLKEKAKEESEKN